MQANGCPVISTDVRALPEINDNEKGWIINVSKNELGEAFYSTFEEREILSKSIDSQLEKIILEIFNNRQSINQKAQLAINHIRENHSMQKYALKLMEIYSESIQK
jgi:glycosyltransferase involved in cell wall biosynthesis